MSQVIDNQIVKMQFDNSSFERNAQESMSTLEKLKQALKFDKVDMTPLQKAFSETEATATKAGFNIRDIWLKVASTIEGQVAAKIVNAGKKVFNALTMEGVTDGFKEYELKMGSIQTIMAGTGESLATVNEYLDELNKYSDQTIYSFSDMTNNIGKFTNAGVKLEDAVNAIKGIANEAAISGANANEASRAMYNFSQALSAGYVKLIDWKSIENANMATKEFKETLLEIGVAMGNVKKSGDGMYQVLTQNNQGKGMDDLVSGTKNFNDSLQYQWMTTEVLTQALELYATDIRTLSTVERQEYETKLKSIGLTDEQIKRFEELGVRATDAASEIKTFTMLMDTLKEAIGSGWAMTWQLVIGDFEQAKALWTDVGNTLSGVIDGMSDARNNFLKASLQTGWEKVINGFGESTAIPDAERFRGVLIDIAHEQGILTKKQYDSITSTETLMKSLHEGAWMTGDLLKESVSEYTEIIKSMSAEEREAAGFSEANVEALDNLNFVLSASKTKADELASSMNNLGGRENIIKGLSNIFHSFLDVLKPIGESFNDVFGILDPDKLFDLTRRFREFTEQLLISEDASNTLKTSFTLAFGGIKAILDGIITTIKGVTKLILPMLNLFDAVFGLLGKIISAITGSKGALDAADKFSAIGDKISDKYLWVMQKLADFINKVADAIRGLPEATIFVKIHDAVEKATESVKNMWETFVNLPIVQQMVSDFWDAVAAADAKISPVLDAVQKKFEALGATVKSKFTWESFNAALTKAYNGFQKLLTIIKDFGTRIKNFFTDLKEGKNIVEAFRENFGDIIEKIQELKQKLTDFFEDLFSKGDELGDKFNLEKIANAIHNFVANITPEQITMLAIAGTFALIALNMMRLSEAVRAAIESFTGIGIALKNVINSYIKKQKSVILQIAESIVIVAAALWVLSTIPKDQLQNAISALITLTACIGALTLVLGGIGVLLGKLGGPNTMIKMASSLAIVGGTFTILALTLKALEYVNIEGVLPKIIVISAVLLGLVAISVIMRRLDAFSKGALTLIAVSGALLLAAVALQRLGEVPADKLQVALEAMLKIMVGLAAVTFAAGRVGVFSVVGLLAVILAMNKILPAIEDIVNYDYTAINKGIEQNKETLQKLGLLVGVMVAIGALAGNRLKGTAVALFAISGIFLVLLGISKLAGMMKPQELKKGEQFLWSMAGIIALIELCSRNAKIGEWGGKGAGEGSKMFIRIALAMGIMLGIAKLASMMEVKDLVKGEIAVLGLIGLIGAMIIVANRSEKAEGVVKSVSGMMFALATVLGMVALLSLIPLKSMAPALVAVLAILGVIAALAYAVSKTNKILDKNTQMKASTLAGFIAALVTTVILGSMLIALANLPVEQVTAGAGALLAVIGAATALAFAMGRIKGGFNAVQIETAVVSLFMVFAIGFILSELTKQMQAANIDPNTMLKAAAAIAVVLVGLTPALAALSMFKDTHDYEAMATAIGGAIAALIVATAAIGLLSRFGGTNVVDSATAIAIALVAICAPIAILGAVGKFCEEVDLKSMATIVGAALLALAGVAGAILLVSNFGNPDTMIQSATALAIGLAAISVPIAVLGAVGKFCDGVGKGGLASMAVATVGAIVAMAAVAAILVWFSQSINPASLEVLNQAMPALLLAVAAVSVLAVAIAAAGRICKSVTAALAGGVVILEAIAAFAIIIAAIAGLGELIITFEGLGPAILVGLDYMVIIFEKIGDAIGSFVSGFGKGLTSQLGAMADNLINFSEKMIEFSDNMAQINDSAINGCKNLAAAMLFITAAEFLDGITRFLGIFGIKGTDKFDFAPLGNALAKFCDSIKDISEASITKADLCSQIAVRLAEVASSLGYEGGVISFFIGNKQSLKKFGEGVAEFGNGLKQFCEAVKDIPNNAVEIAQRAADAAKPMVDFTKTLMNTGGLVQDIIGEKDLGKFGENLGTFVIGLASFIGGLKQLEEIAPNYPELIQTCADATAPMVDLASGIENSGGKLAEWLGDNTLDVFGKTLEPFAEGLKSFVQVLKAINEEVPNYVKLIASTADATQPLVTLANNLENMGGAVSGFTGDNTLDKFGDTLTSFGVSLANYAASITNVQTGTMNGVTESVTKLIEASKLAAEVPENVMENIREVMIDLADISTLELNDGSEVISAVVNLITNIKTFVESRVVTDAPTYQRYGSSMVTSIIYGINLDYARLIERIQSMVNSLLTLLTNLMAPIKFRVYGQNIISGIIMGINEKYPDLDARLRRMVSDILALLNTLMAESVFKIYGQNIVNGIIAGINDRVDPYLIKAINDMVKAITDILDEDLSYDVFYEYGRNAVQGLVDGINENYDDAADAARAMAEAVSRATQEGLQERSPSKLTYKFGKFWDKGLANGISDYVSEVTSASKSMTDGVIRQANTIISAIKDVIDSDIDTQPTIRPVLDTSDITDKAKFIGRLFNSSDLSLAYNASGTMKHISEERSEEVRKAREESDRNSTNNSQPNQINFTQNNYSPKPLSRVEIYRDTKNTLSMMKGVMLANG